jgi:hypothetical protein
MTRPAERLSWLTPGTRLVLLDALVRVRAKALACLMNGRFWDEAGRARRHLSTVRVGRGDARGRSPNGPWLASATVTVDPEAAQAPHRIATFSVVSLPAATCW